MGNAPNLLVSMPPKTEAQFRAAKVWHQSEIDGRRWGGRAGVERSRLSNIGQSLGLTSFLAARDQHLVVALKLQKYHRSKSSGIVGDTSAFTHRSRLATINRRGEVWIPHRLSKQARRAIEELVIDRRRDFYPRFRATAGLPDERLARGAQLPIDPECLRLFLEKLEKLEKVDAAPQ